MVENERWADVPGEIELLLRLAYRLSLDIGEIATPPRVTSRARRLFLIIDGMLEEGGMITHDVSNSCQLAGRHCALLCGEPNLELTMTLRGNRVVIRANNED